ncbi:MAG: hypothetical protein HQL56_01485 [Magnetococcales bacterium]|nr:hypothetical protein [Magnetococcales bacterium]
MPKLHDKKVLFDSSIIQQVIELWRMANPDGQAVPLSIDQVQTIMETVFLAGLKWEEGRPVRACVALVPPHSLPTQEWQGGQVVLAFDKPLPFTIETVVKLSPAVDPFTQALAVWASVESPSRLEIWGMAFTSRRGRHRFDPLVQAYPSPDVMTISSRKVGHLTVFRGNHLVTRFNAGRFSRPHETPFIGSLMSWSMLRVIRTHVEFQRFGMNYWQVYRAAIDRLLVEANKLGHGGTIIWVPEVHVEDARPWIVPRYATSKGVEGITLLSRLCELEERAGLLNEGDPDQSEACGEMVPKKILGGKRAIVEHVELLAQLTQVDGALILSDRLRPICFGAMLDAPYWRRQTLVGAESEGEGLKNVDRSSYGMRHNSAVNFVGQCPFTTAFVISQDGNVVGLSRKDEHAVYWLPDCLSNLWVV